MSEIPDGQPPNTKLAKPALIIFASGAVLVALTLVCPLLVIAVIAIDQLKLWCALPVIAPLVGCP